MSLHPPSPAGTAIWGSLIVYMSQTAGAGVKHLAAGVLWSSPMLRCGSRGGSRISVRLGVRVWPHQRRRTSGFVARAPAGEVGVCRWLRRAGNLGRFGSGGLHGGRTIPLLHVSLGGWHPLPLACDGCGRILPDLESLGTKSSVLAVEFRRWGPHPLQTAVLPHASAPVPNRLSASLSDQG